MAEKWIKKAIKKFWKWKDGNNKAYPDLVEWIDTYVSVKEVPAISREEVEKMKALDPVPAFAEALIKQKILTQKALDKLEAEIKAQVEEAVQHAESAPYPDVAEAIYPVYVEDIRHG